MIKFIAQLISQVDYINTIKGRNKLNDSRIVDTMEIVE